MVTAFFAVEIVAMKTRLFALSALFIVSLLNARVHISGVVTSRNKPVKNVSVTLKDTYDGATTDETGRYSFETSEKGSQKLIFNAPDYAEVEKEVVIGEASVTMDAELKEKISEISAVTITAGSIEASDKKRATALLSPVDIYTTAGADAQITKALEYLPGVQKVGETEGLFVRGGTGTETKIFMDGALINNYFSNSVPGIAGRDRFNTSLFQGNIFSSGGYSALYGQALSSVLLLESVDLPARTSYDIGGSPLFLSGSYQFVDADKTYSYGVQAGYSNLGLMTKLLDFNTDFTKAPEAFNGNVNFRFKTKGGGMLKYYGSYDQNVMRLTSPSLEPEYSQNSVGLKGANTFQTLAFRQKLGRYLLRASTSYSFNKNNIDLGYLNNGATAAENQVNNTGNYLNGKIVVERKIKQISAVRGGVELNNADERTAFNSFTKNYNDLISSVFAETDLGFSNYLSAKIGIRAEHSSYLNKNNIAPRLALGCYRLSPSWTGSLAYGIFYQNPESKYINSAAPLDFQRADHYIFQVQHSANGRSLRMEAFYKNYEHLIKTVGNSNFQTAVNNAGNGYAKGVEVFWHDKKSIKTVDYWLSYSYLDTERDFLNYPVSLTPGFAAKHTLSAVAKKFVTPWKTQFNLSYNFATGRPYYDIISDNHQNVIRHEGRLKNYNALNFSVNYLPNLGKTDSKAFTVVVLGINNILGTRNVFGYNFSNDGLRSMPVVAPVNRFAFIGVFISFGIDKTDEAINSNL